MPDDEQTPRERAARLRKQIERLKAAERDSAEEQAAERKPGESLKEYEERLERRWKGRIQKGLRETPPS